MNEKEYLDSLEKKYSRTPPQKIKSGQQTVSNITAHLVSERLQEIEKNTRESDEKIKREYLYAATGEGPTPEEIELAEDPEEVVTPKIKKAHSRLLETISIVVSALVVIAVIFTFIFRPVGVSGHSMEDTLHDGDWLVVQTVYNNPSYGDIVVVVKPNEFNEPIIKRVIAVGGQKVDIDFNQGYVFVDDQALNEVYAKTMTTEHVSDEMEFPLYVPFGCVFVMGDNRNNSTDSRSKIIGFVEEEYILGKAIFRIFPAGSPSIYDYTE